MRLAVAHISQETDTFNPRPSTLAGFEAWGLHRGPEMLAKGRGVGAVGGFLEAVDAAGPGVEVVPILKARDVAGGRLADDVLAAFTTELVDGLREAGAVDGVALLLHGACAAESEDDVDGHLIASARAVVGPHVPVVVALDHHGNVTRRMAQHATAMVADRTQPHDIAQTARLATELLIRTVAGEVAPTTAFRTLRLISHQEQFLTDRHPMRTWFERAREIERSDGVLSVSTFPMQPWLDVAEAGWSVVVVTDADHALAERYAEELADLAWSMREEFQVTTSVPPAEAVARAAATDGPVVLSDTGDSVAGGAGGDSTVLLRELLGRGAPTALVPLVDPEAARTLATAGVGATVELELGGAVTGWYEPVTVRGTVRSVDPDAAVHPPSPYPHGRVRMGTAVVVDVENVTLVVSELPGPAGNHPAQYEHFGIDPGRYGAVVVKTASNFQWYAHLSVAVVRAATPGPTQSDLAGLPWQRAPRPIFPLDDVADWR